MSSPMLSLKTQNSVCCRLAGQYSHTERFLVGTFFKKVEYKFFCPGSLRFIEEEISHRNVFKMLLFLFIMFVVET